DGNTDLAGLGAAIATAKAVTDRPSLIKVTTTIGYGSPNRQNTAGIHGAALGAEEIQATRANLGWSYGEFEVPADVLRHMGQAVDRGAQLQADWESTLAAYRTRYSQEAAEFERLLTGQLPADWVDALPTYTPADKALATRKNSEITLNALAPALPELIGGSADLTHSNLTELKISGSFQKGQYANRNLRFGVREHGMGAICNGIALHNSGLIPYCATFLVFADYMRAAIRLSALAQAGVIYVMTHDSIGLGEDGPTHQPVETIASLRAIPNLIVLRPADGTETSAAYKVAVEHRQTPTLIALSRQNLPNLPGSSIEGVAKGAYVVDDCSGTPDLILIGTGSEVSLCIEAAQQLRATGTQVRVVSMPSWELFEAQDSSYHESVLPKAVTKRLAVEAGIGMGWCRYVGSAGDVISIERFGASAPGGLVTQKFGYTVENVVARAQALLA
ncbi:MAG: transketolase family protein, partial [Nodosilinea sp.]